MITLGTRAKNWGLGRVCGLLGMRVRRLWGRGRIRMVRNVHVFTGVLNFHRRTSMSAKHRVTVSFCLFLLAFGVSGCRTSASSEGARFLERGQTLLAKKEYLRALLEFRNASSVMPNNAEPYYQMGLAYLESRDLANAVRAFNKAIALNPKHPGAQLKLSELMASTRDEKLINEAVSRIKDVFGPSPADPEAIQALAIAEWKLGKPAEAAERLEQALKKFPPDLQSSQTLARMKMSQNDWNGAEEVLKKAVENAPKSSVAVVGARRVLCLTSISSTKAEASSEQIGAARSDKRRCPGGSGAGSRQPAKKLDAAEQILPTGIRSIRQRPHKPLHAMFLYQIGRREDAVAELSRLLVSPTRMIA